MMIESVKNDRPAQKLRREMRLAETCWDTLNANCSVKERQEYNDWRTRTWLAADYLRDWVRRTASIHEIEIPEAMEEVFDEISLCPILEK